MLLLKVNKRLKLMYSSPALNPFGKVRGAHVIRLDLESLTRHVST
jgi:hypothetical protein